MKIGKFSLVLSLLLLGLFIFQSITSIVFFENSLSSKIEFKVDDRKTKTSMDDSFLMNCDISTIKFSLNTTSHLYKDIIYTFKLSDKLFKPPIF